MQSGIYGDPHRGLLKAILDEVRTLGPGVTFRSVDVTEALLRKGWPVGGIPQTPERSVNRSCSQSPEVFEHVGPDEYRLKPNWR